MVWNIGAVRIKRVVRRRDERLVWTVGPKRSIGVLWVVRHIRVLWIVGVFWRVWMERLVW